MAKDRDPARAFRIPPELWDRMSVAAQGNGESVSQWALRAFRKALGDRDVERGLLMGSQAHPTIPSEVINRVQTKMLRQHLSDHGSDTTKALMKAAGTYEPTVGYTRPAPGAMLKKTR